MVANLRLEDFLGAKAPRPIPGLVTTNLPILVVGFLETSRRQPEGVFLEVETILPVEEDCSAEAPTPVLLVWVGVLLEACSVALVTRTLAEGSLEANQLSPDQHLGEVTQEVGTLLLAQEAVSLGRTNNSPSSPNSSNNNPSNRSLVPRTPTVKIHSS